MNEIDSISFVNFNNSNKYNLDNYNFSIEFLVFPFYLATLIEKINYRKVKEIVFHNCFCTRIVLIPKKDNFFKFGKNIYFTFGFVPSNFLSYKKTHLSLNSSFFELKPKNFYFDIGSQIGEVEKKIHRNIVIFNNYKKLNFGLFVSDIRDFDTQFFLNIGLEINVYTNFLCYGKNFFYIGALYKVWYNFLRFTASKGIVNFGSFEIFLPLFNQEKKVSILSAIIGSYTNLKGLSNYLTVTIGFKL